MTTGEKDELWAQPDLDLNSVSSLTSSVLWTNSLTPLHLRHLIRKIGVILLYFSDLCKYKQK